MKKDKIRFEIEIFCVHGTLGLEIMNAPGTARVQSSKRAEPVFLNGIYSVSKKLSA